MLDEPSWKCVVGGYVLTHATTLLGVATPASFMLVFMGESIALPAVLRNR